MYVTRTLHLGLIVFAVVLLAGSIVSKRSCPEPAPSIATSEPVTVVDVARGVSPSELSNLVRLRADERVVAVGELAVTSDLAAGVAIAERSLASGSFLDLTVAGAHGSRRVLVLMH